MSMYARFKPEYAGYWKVSADHIFTVIGPSNSGASAWIRGGKFIRCVPVECLNLW